VADCNSGAGQYTLDGANLTLLPGAMTLVACEPDSLSEPYLQLLGQVVSFDDGDSGLVLNLGDGGSLSFVSGGPYVAEGGTGGELEAADPLAGSAWQWTHFRDAKQDFDVTGAYTITFNADGTVAVTADCNQANGSYRVAGADLTITIMATTAAACPVGSLGGSFVEYLNQAGTFVVADNTLSVDLMADGGTMAFVAIP
jgi:heat shock protein HslJ